MPLRKSTTANHRSQLVTLPKTATSAVGWYGIVRLLVYIFPVPQHVSSGPVHADAYPCSVNLLNVLRECGHMWIGWRCTSPECRAPHGRDISGGHTNVRVQLKNRCVWRLQRPRFTEDLGSSLLDPLLVPVPAFARPCGRPCRYSTRSTVSRTS